MKKKVTSEHIRYIAVSALLAAMILLVTAYVLHIPVGTGDGYIHLGDTMIYVAASLLPAPYAMAAAALGGGLADILSGAAVWAPFTVVITAVMVLPFTHKSERLLCGRNGLALLIAGVTGVAGYAAAAGLLYGSLAFAVADVFFNVGQEAASAAVFVVLALALDKAGIKKRLFRG